MRKARLSSDSKTQSGGLFFSTRNDTKSLKKSPRFENLVYSLNSVIYNRVFVFALRIKTRNISHNINDYI